MNAKSDFVEVQLTVAGMSFAGTTGSVRVATGHFAYTFAPGKPVRVLTSEWSRVLAKQTYQGKPILALVADASTAAVISAASASTSNPADELKKLRTAEAVLQSQIAEGGK